MDNKGGKVFLIYKCVHFSLQFRSLCLKPSWPAQYRVSITNNASPPGTRVLGSCLALSLLRPGRNCPPIVSFMPMTTRHASDTSLPLIVDHEGPAAHASVERPYTTSLSRFTYSSRALDEGWGCVLWDLVAG